MKTMILSSMALFMFTTVPLANAQTWAKKPSGTTASMIGVWSPDSSNAWAVGAGGAIVKWNGTSWSAQASGSTVFLTGVWGTSPTDVWAVGWNSTLLHYNGTSWAAVTAPVNGNFNGIWGYDATHIWVVGSNGIILKWDGTAWAAQTSGSAANLIAVSGYDASNVWAVGDGGTILKWNGTAWSAQNSGTSTGLSGVYAADGFDVFACGGLGVILKFDGTNWAAQTSGVTNPMRGIWGVSGNIVWACTNGGKVLFWNGTAWTQQTSSTTSDLAGIGGNGSLDVWSIGTSGTIIRFTPAASSLYTYTFKFTPAGSGTIVYYAGTARGTVEDKDLNGSEVVKLPGAYVTFKASPYPGYSLSTISSPQLGGLLHTNLAATPKLDNVTPLTPTFGFNVNNTRTLEFVYAGKAEEPTGGYVLTSPPEGKATPVSSATGNFSGIIGIRQYDFDLATDETGKFTGMGTVEGMKAVIPGTPPTTSPDLNVGGTMTTLSGKPTGSLTGAFSGSVDTRPAVKGSMSATLPFDPNASLNAVASGSGTVAGYKASISKVTMPIPGPTGGGQRAWSYTLDIVEKTDAKGLKYKAATCVLNLPTGDKILFPEKPATYAAKTGYAISCTYGIKLDSNGRPILMLDSKGVLITVAKTSLLFTGLKFAKVGTKWNPSAGTVKYTFMGQTGTANVMDFGIQ